MADILTKQKQNEIIIAKFHLLRNEQKNLASKIAHMELDLKEHKAVIETLKLVEEGRKCFRLIGGVLCERTVKEVLPQLIENKDMLEKAIQNSTETLTKKGIELNKFKEENNVKLRTQEPTIENDSKVIKQEDGDNRNVLVSN